MRPTEILLLALAFAGALAVAEARVAWERRTARGQLVQDVARAVAPAAVCPQGEQCRTRRITELEEQLRRTQRQLDDATGLNTVTGDVTPIMAAALRSTR